MKNYLLIAYWMFFISLSLTAQPVLMKDEFDSDNGDWLVKNNESVVFKIENGIYSLQDKDTTQRWYCWRDIDYFSHKLDFEIETKLKLKSGSSKSEFGIAWALSDLKTLNVFGISGDGNFFIQYYINDKLSTEEIFTKSSSIKEKGNYNILKII